MTFLYDFEMKAYLNYIKITQSECTFGASKILQTTRCLSGVEGSPENNLVNKLFMFRYNTVTATR
jgi:hypothetical protein